MEKANGLDLTRIRENYTKHGLKKNNRKSTDSQKVIEENKPKKGIFNPHKSTKEFPNRIRSNSTVDTCLNTQSSDVVNTSLEGKAIVFKTLKEADNFIENPSKDRPTWKVGGYKQGNYDDEKPTISKKIVSSINKSTVKSNNKGPMLWFGMFCCSGRAMR